MECGERYVPRFNQCITFDHRLDNQVTRKDDLRFPEQDSAEEFATAQYLTDYVPRSVIRGLTGLYMVLESPSPRGLGYAPHPNEVFYINDSAE